MGWLGYPAPINASPTQLLHPKAHRFPWKRPCIFNLFAFIICVSIKEKRDYYFENK